MKPLLSTLALLLFIHLSGSDYGKLMDEAAAAVKKKDSALAFQKFSEAYRAASNTADRYQNVTEHAAYLSTLKKWEARQKLLEEELRKSEYSDMQKQMMLIWLAHPHLWSKKYEYALDKLNLALCLDGADASTGRYFMICYYAAVIYYHRRHEYEPVIVLLEPLTLALKYAVHLFPTHSLLGAAYARLGRKQEAVSHYRKAILYGKKLKKDTRKIEKLVEDLSK